MIKVCDFSDYENIIRIWNSAFGDSREYIMKFLDMFHEFVYVHNDDAIMTLLPVTLNDKFGHYIYAVAVDKNKRNKGIGKKLIEFAKEKMQDFLVLVPADRGLFEYYQKFGFVNNSPIGKYQTVKADEKISAKEYFLLRDKYFQGKNYIKWDETKLLNIASLYNANFYKNKESTEIAMLSKNRVIEYLGDLKPIEEKPFSMIFPEVFKNSYFNIAID